MLYFPRVSGDTAERDGEDSRRGGGGGGAAQPIGARGDFRRNQLQRRASLVVVLFFFFLKHHPLIFLGYSPHRTRTQGGGREKGGEEVFTRPALST